MRERKLQYEGLCLNPHSFPLGTRPVGQILSRKMQHSAKFASPELQRCGKCQPAMLCRPTLLASPTPPLSEQLLHFKELRSASLCLKLHNSASPSHFFSSLATTLTRRPSPTLRRAS